MILSTHAIVGAAIATLFPDHPALAFISGVASHFAIDAIPHWDYRLRSISIKQTAAPALSVNWGLFQDFGMITIDAGVGLAVALWLFASPAAFAAVLLGGPRRHASGSLAVRTPVVSAGTSWNTAAIPRLDSQQAQTALAAWHCFSVFVCSFDYRCFRRSSLRVELTEAPPG